MTDFSHEAGIIQIAICEEAAITRYALTAPHVLMKPRIFPDGDAWCALLGENLQEGICGFGATPAQAAGAFDDAWRTARTPDAMIAERTKAEEQSDG